MPTPKSKLDLLYELRERYGTPSPTEQFVATVTPVPEKAFVTQGKGRTVITAPLREVAAVNEGFLYLHGRLVEADNPNVNGAMWTTEDLQIGEATVAGGPLNWLHDERMVVGCLMDGRLVTAREAADAGDDSGIGNHITSTAAMWEFLYPRQADTLRRAAADHQLYYSMECLSRAVGCIDTPGRPGCGEEFSYADYDAKRACAHLNGRSVVTRFVDPYFLGAAVIVPPVQPGWAQADLDVVRAAAEQAERANMPDMSTDQARNLAAAIIEWANR